MQQSTAAHVISSHPYDMATTVSRPPAKLFELDLTIVSAKHLKNVNWHRGDLKPYVILWVDPERRLATKSDDSGSTRPVWNERFVLPLNLPPSEATLTLEIFHSKPSETDKPLVGTLRVLLRDFVDLDKSNKLSTFELLRPSGRPQGKIRLKLALREHAVPDYQIPPPSSYCYSPGPASPLGTREYRGYSSSAYNSQSQPAPSSSPPSPPPPAISPPLPPPPMHSCMYVPYSDQYTSYYPGYYSQPPVHPQLPPPMPSFERNLCYSMPGPSAPEGIRLPSPPRPSFFERNLSYSMPGPSAPEGIRLPPPPRPSFFEQNLSYSMPGPSAPEDYASYDQKRGGKMGVGTGLGVGAVVGGLGGLTLEERSKYEEQKIREKVENDLEALDEYSSYRAH